MNSKETDYIKYRLSRAKETFIDAQLLAKNGRWNACVNRLYYACFYAVTALLFKHGKTPKTHKGVKMEFGQHFVKKGKVSAEHGTLLTDLEDWRYKGDYGDMFDFDGKTIKPLIPQVKKFLRDIEKLIKETN
jgi:uncharacterized protein